MALSMPKLIASSARPLPIMQAESPSFKSKSACSSRMALLRTACEQISSFSASALCTGLYTFASIADLTPSLCMLSARSAGLPQTLLLR
jgi:hypothetical protein